MEEESPGKPTKPQAPPNLTLLLLVSLGALAVVLVGWKYLFEIKINPSQRFLHLIGQAQPTPTAPPAPTVDLLKAEVVPEAGYTVKLAWGDIGKKLVASGAIDIAKYQQNYKEEKHQELLAYLTDTQDKGITINADNAYFWVNTLWALGLTQKSDVLEKGVMGTEYKDKIGSFASTGGWTLGAKKAVDLYSSSGIISLTAEQQALVNKISQGIYRPCCGNPTSFPDCNHGMAILGLIELMVAQGFSEKEIYQAALAFNSYWFSQTYLDLAYYFQTKENTLWKDVDPQKVLGATYSSGPGYQAIKKQIGNIPGSTTAGGSCGA